MLSELQSFNLKLCSKQYSKIFVLHLVVTPKLSSGWWQLLNQNKAGRPPQWAVYVFSHVYDARAPKLIAGLSRECNVRDIPSKEAKCNLKFTRKLALTDITIFKKSHNI